MRRKEQTSFIVELFILFALLVLVITVVTVITVRARGMSKYAETLTGAVVAAENTAEMTAEAATPEEAAHRLRQMEDSSGVKVDGNTITLQMDAPSKEEAPLAFDVEVKWSEEQKATGAYIEKTFVIYEHSDTKPVYTMKSGQYIKGGQK